MLKPRIERVLPWMLIAGIVVAGCGGRPTPAAAPQPLTPPVASAIEPTEMPADEGGVTADEPVVASLAPTVAPAMTSQTSPGAVRPSPTPTMAPTATDTPAPTPAPTASLTPTAALPSQDPYPLQVEVMRRQSYPGSEIVMEQMLEPGPNYSQYVVSYMSDGNKIYALMTVPNGPKPATGWPVIIFNHGYIPPAQYRTTQRYVAYVDAIAQSGYIVFKSDYRGHGSSQGEAEGAYGFPGYTNDVLNAVASVKAYKDADPNRIGMWGHSLGGQLTLRAMVVSKDIKAGVIWAGVVAPYPNIFARDPRRQRPTRTATETPIPPGHMGPYGRPWRQELTEKYGTAEQNPAFWASISPNSYLADISGPLQLDHSVTDAEVPVAASETLYKEMQAAGKIVELFTYPNDNHNISKNFATAMQRTIAFYDKYVKGS